MTWRKCKFCGNVAGIAHSCECGNDRYWGIK